MRSQFTLPRLWPLVVLLVPLPAWGAAAAGEPVVALAPYVITAARAPQAIERLPVAVDVFEATRLQGATARTLDDTLREAAAFSLFRRSGSMIANPTAQGVSLRNVGPSGASRSLVLLDGIPLNDPFGGWVAWSSVPISSLDRVEIVRGGGSGAWGNSALSGTVQLFSAAPDRRAGAVTAAAGDYGLRTGEANAAEPIGHGSLALSLGAYTLDGFRVLAPSQRGPVDEALWSRQQSALLGWRQPVGPQATLQLGGRYFREKRGNGTPLQKNDSESGQVAVAMSGATPGQLAWRAAAYFQEQSFASFFSSVNTARTAETPANDQFDVPATAGGASLSFVAQGDRATTSGGADLRWVKGETREKFLFAAGQFTRLRRAGGEQSFVGAFLNHDRALAAAWRGLVGVRLDSWSNRDGHRRESDLATGAIVRDDHYASRRGFEFSPQLGLVWTPVPSLKWRGSAYQAFRVPTLNEYYRPFRVGTVTTEANAALERETLTGAELGVEFSRNAVRLTGTAFVNELRDAVGNVTQSPTSRLRLNLDRVRIQGLELGAEWRPESRLRVRADALVSEARVRRAAVRPALEGLRLAQTPRLTLASGIDWQAAPTWRTTIGVRYGSGQYEDDENGLWLAPMALLNVGVTKSLGAHLEFSLAVENLLDRRIETGRSADGIVTLGPPRMARLGIRWVR